MAEEDTGECTDECELLTFLRSISLEQYYEACVCQGITKTDHLEDVEEKDAENFGMTKFEAKRLTHEFSAWKVRKSKQQTSQTSKQASQPEYKVSKSSIVLPLRPGFRTYFQTRDGQGNIVVPADRLKVKFKDLWYKNALNPFQQLSNTFILEMAEYRQQFEVNLRSCELWCRKMRTERIQLLMACAQPSLVSKWSIYYKKKSVEGLHQLMKERYPEVAQIFKDDHEEEQNIPRLVYDSLCKYQEGLEQAQMLAKESVQKCEERITSCSVPRAEDLLETKNFYQKLMPSLEASMKKISEEVGKVLKVINEAKEKHGSSGSLLSLQRKRKKNLDKDKKWKMKKAEANKKVHASEMHVDLEDGDIADNADTMEKEKTE